MRKIQPDDTYKPASNYAQGVVHSLTGERLVVAGQLGITPDGVLEEGLEAQADRAWQNVLGVMRAAGFDTSTLVKAVIYCTVPGSVGVYRESRDRALDGHLCACTYVEIAGLAAKEHLIEIEAEAVKE